VVWQPIYQVILSKICDVFRNSLILLCVRGATLGRKNIADRRYCIGRGLASIRGKAEQATTDFLWFSLELVTQNILKDSSGSTFPNIPGAKLEKTKMPIPPLRDQQRLAEILNNELVEAEHLQKSIKDRIDKINALPAALLRRAFNGEL
jgi:type I restriction enzyme S subunit